MKSDEKFEKVVEGGEFSIAFTIFGFLGMVSWFTLIDHLDFTGMYANPNYLNSLWSMISLFPSIFLFAVGIVSLPERKVYWKKIKNLKNNSGDKK